MEQLSGLQIFGLYLSVGVPAVSWAWWFTSKLNGMDRKTDTLVKHEEKAATAIREQTKATRQLIRVVKWGITEQTGKEPPPYLED